MKKLLIVLTIIFGIALLLIIKKTNPGEEYTEKFLTFKKTPDKGLEIYAPYLYNGKSVIFRLPTNECILFDCGSSEDFPALYEKLRSLEINTIDYVVITSASTSSIGGLSKVLENFCVYNLYISKDLSSNGYLGRITKALEINNTEVSTADEGTRIYEYEDTVIDVVCTQKYACGKEVDSMCVYIICGEKSIFVEGECDIATEARMSAELRDSIKSDILIMSYGGERDIQSQYFIEEVDPEYVILPVYNEKEVPYGLLKHFDEDTILRTDEDGNISFFVENKTVNYTVDN